MNVEMREYRAEHALELVKTIANHDGISFDGFDEWAQQHEGLPGYTVIVDGKVAGVAGVLPLRGKSGEVWAMIDNGIIKRSPSTVARWSRVLIDTFVNRHGFERIQASIDEQFVENMRFAQWLGFELEGVHRKAGDNGENVYVLAWVGGD